jgi:nucleotide-binding universal stress UspA family protein
MEKTCFERDKYKERVIAMKLLVAYDEDALSSKVLNQALKRAEQSNAHVFLIHTFDSDTKEEDFIAWEKRLNEIQQEVFEKNGVKNEVHILVRGLSPGEDIIKFAAQNNIDEIIIGIKKRSRVGKLMFGSTARYVILESNCPVLTVN